jgi:hypothetical protein
LHTTKERHAHHPTIIPAVAAAALTAAVMAGSAGAVATDAHNPPNGWHAGKSTLQPSTHDTRKASMFVLTPDLGLGDATAQSAAPPTRPANPEPIDGSHAVVNAPAPRLDWGSAGIGAAAGTGACAIALALTAGLRRRRTEPPDR